MSTTRGPYLTVCTRPMLRSICLAAARSAWGASVDSTAQAALIKRGWSVIPQGSVS